MKIKIKITKEILEKSKMCGVVNKTETPMNCAFALATREIFPKAIVGETFILPFGDTDLDHAVKYIRDAVESNAIIKLPQVASGYIALFDSLKGMPVARTMLPEMSFEVDVPSCIIDKIGIGEVYKVLSESKTLELVSI